MVPAAVAEGVVGAADAEVAAAGVATPRKNVHGRTRTRQDEVITTGSGGMTRRWPKSEVRAKSSLTRFL